MSDSFVAEGIADKRGLMDSSNKPANSPSATPSDDVVFTDYIAYSPLIIWLLLVAPITTLSCVVVVYFDEEQPPDERELSIKILLSTTAFILLLYLFILPFRVSVKSNGNVCVRVIPLRYTFTETVRAYLSPGIFDRPYLSRIKFVTHQDKRVVVVRRKGKWDICISPKNPKEFMGAINNVTNALDSHGVVS